MDFLKENISKLKNEKNAIILAHNYQRPEVQDIADFVGDSLGLSRQAAATNAKVIIFCGVHFMAETAYILSPDKTVILPDINAGCPMADMIDSQRLLKAKKENPSAIVVTYVNSSADVKAYSDICCTSSNAIEVVRSIKGNKILFTPDENLGRYVARHCPDKEFIFWKGFCPTHHFIKAEQINALKERYNDAVAMVHPECREEVIDCADYVGSTSQMFDWARQSQAKTIIVGTELGMVYRLKKENPDKIFLPPTADTLCPNMKLTTLEKVYHSLKKLAPKITVDENIRTKALNAVTKMLQIG